MASGSDDSDARATDSIASESAASEGRSIVFSGKEFDKTVRLWSAATGSAVAVLEVGVIYACMTGM